MHDDEIVDESSGPATFALPDEDEEVEEDEVTEDGAEEEEEYI